MMRRLFTSLMAVSAVSALLTLAPPKALALPTLQVENGILMGATGVDVGGTLYDVQFVDGTCIDLFSGCDSSTDFTFDLPTAAVASQALLGQVFTGTIDSDPYTVYGCQSIYYCAPLTPFAVSLPSTMHHYVAVNLNESYYDFDDYVTPNELPTTLDTGLYSHLNFARWTPTAATVPEPATVLLLASGLLGLIGYHWRLRREAGLQVG